MYLLFVTLMLLSILGVFVGLLVPDVINSRINKNFSRIGLGSFFVFIAFTSFVFASKLSGTEKEVAHQSQNDKNKITQERVKKIKAKIRTQHKL